jgi:hypothetical protein
MGLEGTPLYRIAWHMVCLRLAADNGATGTQLTALFGWATSKQVTQYTRVVDQRICSSRGAKAECRLCCLSTEEIRTLFQSIMGKWCPGAEHDYCYLSTG